jgi:hypothetical protein
MNRGANHNSAILKNRRSFKMRIRQKNLWMVSFLITSMLGLSIDTGIACDYCMLSQGLSPLQTSTGIGIRIDERYSVLSHLYEGRDKIDNPGNKESFLTTQATVFYAINEDLTALLVIPFSVKKMTEVDETTGETVKGTATGIGDLSLMGRYTFFKRHQLDSTSLIAGLIGVKFPTGATDKTDDAGELMDSHIQPGTGSTDVLLGLNLSYALGRFTLAANPLYVIPGQGEALDQQHKFGNMFNWDVTGIYRIYPAMPPGPTVSLALGVAGEWRGKETQDDINIGGQGNVVYLNTGVLYIPFPKWIAELNYRPAIFHDLPPPPPTGGETQLGEDYKLLLSLTHVF